MTTDTAVARPQHGLDVDADAVAKAVLDCPSVMGLGDEIATFRFGRRIAGVHIHDGIMQVHVLGRYDVTVAALCAEISAAVMPLVPSHLIDITVIDMVDPHEFLDVSGG